MESLHHARFRVLYQKLGKSLRGARNLVLNSNSILKDLRRALPLFFYETLREIDESVQEKSHVEGRADSLLPRNSGSQVDQLDDKINSYISTPAELNMHSPGIHPGVKVYFLDNPRL